MPLVYWSFFALVLLGVVAVNNAPQIAEGAGRLFTRGIRNNNPGNLRITDIPWQGKVPVVQNTDGEFEQFFTADDGIRALARDLKSKLGRGLRSIRSIITVYAPPSENDTDAYVSSVSNRTGIDPDALVDVGRDLYALVDAIMVHETAGDSRRVYSEPQIREAIARA